MPHSIIHGNACFAYFNKIWDIPRSQREVQRYLDTLWAERDHGAKSVPANPSNVRQETGITIRMIAAAWFAAGIIAGLILAAIGIVIALRWPEPKRERPFYSAIGAGHARTSGPASTFDFLQRRLR
jgi:hypothetical protein